MAYCTTPFQMQVALTGSPLASDHSSLRLRTSLFKTSNINLFDKTGRMIYINNGQPTKEGRRSSFMNRKLQVVCRAGGEGSRVPVAPLELEDDRRPPTNLYTAEAPFTATILSNEKISGPNAPNETYKIIFDHGGFLPHWEGQVFGALPPPSDNPFEPGDATKLSYFSGGSSRYGDYFNNRTASLGVRLVPGTTSELLCKTKPGDKFQFTGPVRQAMMLGDFNPNASHIFLATGTGVNPFRAHLRRFFKEDIPTFRFSGFAWLFHGVSNQDSQLYKDEFEQYQKDYPENFRYTPVFSREQQKKYVQDIFAENAKEVFDLVQKGAYLYLAGRKDMVLPVEDALRQVASNEGLNSEDVLATWNANNQWRVEVY